MGDVGDEVVAHRLGAGDLSAVVGEDEDVLVAQGCDPQVGDDAGFALQAARQLELLLDDHSVAADPCGEGQDFAVHHGVAADEPEGVCGGVGPDHSVDGVDDDVPQAQGG